MKEIQKVPYTDKYGEVINPGDACYAKIRSCGNVYVERGVYLGTTTFVAKSLVYNFDKHKYERTSTTRESVVFKSEHSAKQSYLRNNCLLAMPKNKSYEEGYEAGRLSIINSDSKDPTRF